MYIYIEHTAVVATKNTATSTAPVSASAAISAASIAVVGYVYNLYFT